jgi:hypothetical protein
MSRLFSVAAGAIATKPWLSYKALPAGAPTAKVA